MGKEEPTIYRFVGEKKTGTMMRGSVLAIVLEATYLTGSAVIRMQL
jgi:hypothetical protein